jgi:hypothetical protein
MFLMDDGPGWSSIFYGMNGINIVIIIMDKYISMWVYISWKKAVGNPI